MGTALLVFTDRPLKDNALARVFARLFHKPVAIANALGSNQNALGIKAVENVFKAHSLFANPILDRDFKIVDK